MHCAVLVNYSTMLLFFYFNRVKLKLPLYALLLLMLISSCHKKEDISPLKPPPKDKTAIVSVSNILQSNMVIQRDKPFKIWGKAKPSASISVSVTWNNASFTAVTDSFGNWQLTIPASSTNSNPQKITVKDEATTLTLSNILIGDVWVCSGQSNMVMPLGPNSTFQGVTDYATEITAADYPQIRALTLQEDYQPLPADSLTLPANWQVCSPSAAANLSAVAYYFARKLQTTLNVPVGIIIAAVNGSYCESWINNDALKADNFLYATYSGAHQSTELYNGMISPLTNLAIKGFTWYQGENNEHDDPSTYAKLNSALIGGWRNMFNQPDLPFYYVQMTPFDEAGKGDITLDSYAKFREGQASIRTLTAGTGMAVTMDVGEVDNHHPRNKKPVGERLALLALNKTYGQNITCLGPQYGSFTQNGNTVTVSYGGGTSNGLNTIDNAIPGQFFYLAGADHVFHQGYAAIAGNRIMITASADTPLPILAVRYAFTNFPVTNLQNSALLPMEPFRTDSWDN